jgi:hypothetical protein
MLSRGFVEIVGVEAQVRLVLVEVVEVAEVVVDVDPAPTLAARQS